MCRGTHYDVHIPSIHVVNPNVKPLVISPSESRQAFENTDGIVCLLELEKSEQPHCMYDNFNPTLSHFAEHPALVLGPPCVVSGCIAAAAPVQNEDLNFIPSPASDL